ncbi:hypothetical protein O6H91_04G083900 [Diphasiastrum complanatum]|nr:hypothetical protein O6H91_04G083900 [Diphasiastrum complanatum]
MESLSPRERAAERERMVLDIKVKLQGLWRRLLEMGATDDPLSSSEYGTILALIESDAEGIGGSGFVECIGEHIHSGWACQLSEEQFTAVKELIKTTIGRAMSRNDMSTVRDALEISAEVYRKDAWNISDYVQRHLGALPVWDDLRFWEGYFEFIIERSSEKVGNYAALVTEQLSVLAEHMAGLGIPDTEAWFILESIGQKNNLGSKQLIKLRGLLAHSQQVRQGYWGISVNRSQASSGQTQGFHSQQLQGQTTESNQSSEGTAGVGRSWVHSMFSRDRASLAQPAARTRSRSENALMATAKENARADASQGIKRGSSGVRILRGHKAAITALHAVTKSEAGELFGDYEDAGYFISGSADCTVKTWDPALRGSELRTTFEGHTGAVRAISSDRLRVVSGSDDQRVLVWDKSTSQLLEELKGHDAAVICIRMLSGERVLTASHDASVKMWDVRTDTCVATVGRTASAILCMDYDDTTGVLAAAGMDGVGNVWDVRAGKQLHKLIGHTKWIRSLRMVGDTMVTGSDDWTARVWSISRGTCDAVLACHAGGVTCVDYCSTDNGILTGSVDGMVKIWEREDGSLQCTKNVGLHTAAILSVKAGPKWMVIGAADNSMSLFHRQEQRSNVQPNDLGGQASGWQLHRTPQRSAAMVRCVASDVERGRICTGARSGLLRLWDPVSG